METRSPGRRWIKRLVIVAAILVVGMCASVLAVGSYLSSPATAAIGAPPADLVGAETVHIASPSGAVLAGWWLPGTRRGGGGAVVLMHGVRSNRLSMVARARVLQARGFAVLLFDFQAHGESTGRRISYGHREALDAAAAVAFVRQHAIGERIGAIGVSLGGAASVLGPEPLQVDALVLESVYPDIDAALSNRLRASLGPIVGGVFTPLLTPVFELLLPPILGVQPDELRPIDRIGTVTAPLLIASGTEDDRTPIAEAQALFAAAPQPKQFWAVPGAAHVDLERYARDAYWQVVLPFLTEHLQQTP